MTKSKRLRYLIIHSLALGALGMALTGCPDEEPPSDPCWGDCEPGDFWMQSSDTVPDLGDIGHPTTGTDHAGSRAKEVSFG